MIVLIPLNSLYILVNVYVAGALPECFLFLGAPRRKSHCGSLLLLGRGLGAQGKQGGDVVQLVEHRTVTSLTLGSIARCGKGFFSQSQISVLTLLRVSVHPPPSPVCNCMH